MRTSILTPPESADLQDPARQPAAATDLPSAATGIPDHHPTPQLPVHSSSLSSCFQFMNLNFSLMDK